MFSENDSDPLVALQPHTAWCGRTFATDCERISHEDHCPACEAAAATDAEPPCCPHCGKDIYDFSDLGCGHCDRRSPEWGTV